MKIIGDTLLSADASDLDPIGALRIPHGVRTIEKNVGNNLPGLTELYIPDSVTDIKSPVFCNNPGLRILCMGKKLKYVYRYAFSGCPNIEILQIPVNYHITAHSPGVGQNLKKVIHPGNNAIRVYTVNIYNGVYYFEIQKRRIFNVSVISVLPLIFNKHGIKNTPSYVIKYNDQISVSQKLNSAINAAKRNEAEQNFKYIINKKQISHISKGVILESLRYSFICNDSITSAERRALYSFIPEIEKLGYKIDNYIQKYNSHTATCEICDITLPQLSQVISERPNADAPVAAINKYIRHKPISDYKMNGIAITGRYKNPGCFPYQWLEMIPLHMRGDATRRLHSAFVAATRKLYSPYANIFSFVNADTPCPALTELSDALTRITKQPSAIELLGTGQFSKTFIINIGTGNGYVWKIYHSSNTYALSDSWCHNTEIQNSFLLSGKKFYGKIRFRPVSTAGISNQRGERYIIYPYINGDVRKSTIPGSPFEKFKPARPFDLNIENIRGNTIIDMGAIRINHTMFEKPYIRKITNIVIYQDWEALCRVLHKYTRAEINAATEFISRGITSDLPGRERIMAKIRFLQHKTCNAR